MVFTLIVVLFIQDNVRSLNKDEEHFTVTNYFENPQKFGGVKAEHMARIVNISQDHFYVNIGDRDLKIMGSDIKRPVLGETVVYVHYRKDGIVELIDYHNYNYNYFLYGVSFLGLIIFLIIFFHEWKITRGGFEDA